MEKSKIYTLNCNHDIGSIGINSFKVQQPICPQCNRELVKEIKYSELEFEFEEYKGEDMFFSMGCLMVSKSLHDALEEKKIKGYAPIKVKNTKSKYFEGNFKDIGVFIYLAIFPPQIRNIPIAYKFEGKCNECGLEKVDFDTLNMDLMYREDDDDKDSLKVYYDSWNGNDIFNFLDHTEIGVTQKFLDVIKDFNCPENIIIPAEWI